MNDLALLAGGWLIGIMLGRIGLGAEAESQFNRFARRKTPAILACGLLAVVPRIAMLPWLPIPPLRFQDEFSYILGAQTLALGRLTNPTPPMWQFFESYHINLIPSYQSMYPPGPAAFYALGIVALGNPWWGVCLSVGIMCAAICWALQPIIRPRYAFLAGLFCALKYGAYSNFSDRYLGGAVAATGGALALGAAVRLVSGGRPRNILWLGIGLAILANSRPFEGFLFAIPISLSVLIWMIRERKWRLSAAALALAAVILAACGYYNARSTGSALKMPYMANLEQYHFVRPFLGMKWLPRPQYHHPDMAAFYEEWDGVPARAAQSLNGFIELCGQKIKSYYDEHFAPLLLIAFLGMPLAFRSPRRRLLTATFILVGCGLFSVIYRPFSAYPAPLLVSFFGLAMLGIRQLRVLSIHGRRVGRLWGRGLVFALLLFGLGRLGVNFTKGIRAAAVVPAPWFVQRLQLIEDLTRKGGQHLVFVRYAPDHNAHEEWVYNSPDLDRQVVIFARSMGDEADRTLRTYYTGRQFWLLIPGNGSDHVLKDLSH